MLCFTDGDKFSLSTAKSQHEKYFNLKRCIFKVWRGKKDKASAMRGLTLLQ